MRFQSFGGIVGLIGVAALAAASPNGYLDTCDASPSTIFVTVQSLVTIHDAPTSTVYVGMSELPSTTLTTVETVTSFTTQASAPVTISKAAATITIPAYGVTVTETIFATISNGQVVSTSPGQVVSASETTIFTGPFSYMVNHGTTSWLNGQTPTSDSTYVVQTSVVTIIPLESVPATSLDDTSTLTSKKTIFLTQPITITEAAGPTASSSLWHIHPTASAGTGSPSFTMSSGGWNLSSSSSTAAGVTILSSTSLSPSASGIHTANSSIGIYNPSNGVTTSLTTLSAAAGFTNQSSRLSSSTSAVPYTNSSFTGRTSSDIGVITSLSTSYSKNATSSSSTLFLITGTSSALGVLTSSSISRTLNQTGFSSFSASNVLTSSALGVVTPLSSTSYAKNITTPTVSSAPALITSSALSGLTSLLSTSRTENSTTLATSVTSALITSSALDTLTSLSSTSCTENTTALSTSSLVASSVLGALTSISSTSCSENVTIVTPVPSSSFNLTTTVKLTSSSAISNSLNSGTFAVLPSSTVVSVPANNSTVLSSTSSALGVLTSLSSSKLSTTSSVSSTATLFTNIPVTSNSSTIGTTSTSMLASTSSASVNLSSGLLNLPTTLSTSVTSSSFTNQSLSAQPSTTSSSPTSTFAYATATASMCGEIGDFTLNFDDIPPLSIGNQSINTVQPAPIFSPYHQFDFSDGFTVVPPPTDPYLPSSPPLLLEFIPNFNTNGTNPADGPNTMEFGYSGEIGNGDHGLIGCFGFNAYGASFGCDSTGPDCDFFFTGFRYNRASGQTLPVTQQSIAVPACPGLQNCELEPVTLPSTFVNLDSLRINVTVAGQPQIWWMDDLALGWSNNTCTAGLCRLSAHIH